MADILKLGKEAFQKYKLIKNETTKTGYNFLRSKISDEAAVVGGKKKVLPSLKIWH